MADEGRYYDDLVVGEIRESSARKVSLQELLEFATRYDPQYFHADPIAARQSIFGEVIASGIHSAALWRARDHEISGDRRFEGFERPKQSARLPGREEARNQIPRLVAARIELGPGQEAELFCQGLVQVGWRQGVCSLLAEVERRSRFVLTVAGHRSIAIDHCGLVRLRWGFVREAHRGHVGGPDNSLSGSQSDKRCVKRTNSRSEPPLAAAQPGQQVVPATRRKKGLPFIVHIPAAAPRASF